MDFDICRRCQREECWLLFSKPEKKVYVLPNKSCFLSFDNGEVWSFDNLYEDSTHVVHKSDGRLTMIKVILDDYFGMNLVPLLDELGERKKHKKVSRWDLDDCVFGSESSKDSCPYYVEHMVSDLNRED